MPREVILHILCGALKWAQAAHNDADVQVPEFVRRSTLISSYVRVRMSHLLFWALAGLMTEEERKMVTGIR
jgi:hypothetical protein